MVNFLMILHACEEILADVAIHPTDIEVEVANWLQQEIPFEFFGHVLDNRILGF